MKKGVLNTGFQKLTFLTLVLCSLAACGPDPMQEGHHASEAQFSKFDTVEADWDSKPEAAEWSAVTLRALETSGQDMVLIDSPGDASSFCPRFKHLTYEQRLKFYLMLISSMARYESDFKPSLTYVEDFEDSKGKPVVSRGLLQISLESAKGYECEVRNEDDLHNSEKNIKCGVKILNRWIARDKKIGSYGVAPSTGERKYLGGGRYWGVLRKNKWGRDNIRAKTLSLDFCRDREV